MAPRNCQRGEVWWVDLGYAAKRRPALILGVPISEHDRALVTCVTATTSHYGSEFEVDVNCNFLKSSSVFDAQAIVTIPLAKLDQRIGSLDQDQILAVEAAVKRWLGFAE
jgi:mRNA interferase MazF